RAKLLEAEANVEKTLTLIDQKHIRSPFAGQLGLREVNIGEYISPGQTPVVSLQSLEPLYVDFFLPEQRLNQLHLGQIVTAHLTPYPNLRFVGKITAINSKADTETHNVKVQATFSNCPEAALQDPLHSNLLDAKAIDSTTIQIQCDSARNQANHISHYAFIPGMFTSLDIEQPPLPKTLVLPSTSISYSLYGNSVFVIEKEKDDYFVKQRFVKTGEQQGNETVIMSGIESGQLVVSSGELKLQNGTHIVINNDIDLSNATPIDQLGE
ncbi:MAG: efflux transporter periplasmic adaptor subunit, partial [Legionella sp. 21-45-4]